MDKKVLLSQSILSQVNTGRKRKLNFTERQDKVAKENRNHGNPYKSRSGKLNPGILPPQEVRKPFIKKTLLNFMNNVCNEYFLAKFSNKADLISKVLPARL